ncbi:MAG: hypothetical protein JWQ72_587 [Polaromonas sp.]|nr:hypothetical protein [Polaromonas sp.]
MSMISFKQGDESEAISDLQRKLAGLGFYDGPRSGRFDKPLMSAIVAFQVKNGLNPDGACDNATWRQLDEVAGSVFSETFQYELDALHGMPPTGVRPAEESKVIARAHAQQLAGLAFSGGGIRSATFNLGILQALAEHKLLRDFDYLSTVSGGSYIGGWFSKWLKEQAGDIEQAEKLLTPGSNAEPVADEPDPIKFLRQYSNYLTPKTGMFSADTWAVVATYVRNTGLNLTILIAMLAAFLILPRALTWLVFNYHENYASWLFVALLAFLWVVYFIALGISLKPDPANKNPIFAQSQGSVIWLVVVPLMLAGFAGSVGLWDLRGSASIEWLRFTDGMHQASGTSAIAYLWSEKLRVFGYALLPGVVYFVVWLAGWATAQYQNKLPGRASVNWKNLGGEGLGHLLFAIAALALGTLLVLTLLVWAGEWPLAGRPTLHYSHLVALGMPIMLSIFGVTMVLLVGLIGRLYTDSSREWWSREGGWAIICVFGWLVLFFFTYYMPPLLFWANAHLSDWLGAAIASGWLATTVAGVAAGANKSTGKQDSPRWLEFVAQVAPYVFTVGIVVAVSTLVHIVVTPGGIDRMNLGEATLPEYLERYLGEIEAAELITLAIAMAGFLAVGLLLAWRVDINKFSLYMMYRNRLVRAYLGASSKNRRPHPFTAFDPNDDPRFEELFKPDGVHVQRPYHIVNTALNLVKGKELAWQMRKASSFVFTPTFCGFEMPSRPLAGGSQSEQHAARGCFRPTARYGGKHNRINDEDEGTKLGMAIAVSGAAVSPSMGYHSSPPLAFLMTLFNVRLGRWCANPRKQRWEDSGPHLGLFSLIAELFGLTDTDADFVYLSDGGHFENLGLYELVRRRCRLIVVVDASADGKMGFEDLGNAVRKCYTDFRVEVEIDVGRIDRERNAEFSKAYCVAGSIHYGKVDPGAPDGTLLYIKPSLTGQELAEVLNYRKADPSFPHQSTADQWFDETQFESYRSLGYRIGSVALREAAAATSIPQTPTKPLRHDIAALCASLDAQWKQTKPKPEALQAKATD